MRPSFDSDRLARGKEPEKGLEAVDDESGSVPADSLIRYDLMVQEALRHVIKEALTLAANDGLPGEHHYYITFNTTHPGVEMPDSLRTQYPDEMTIVLQHQFWQLDVGETEFSVTLSFSGIPQTLTVPYTAVTAFADPHVRFGLQFHPTEADEAPAASQEGRSDTAADSEAVAESEPKEKQDQSTGPEGAEEDGESPTVVSLDTFRRKR